MPNLRKTSQGVKDVVFANPSDITNTFRAVVAVAPKRVGQNTFTNARSEAITASRIPIMDEKCCGPVGYDVIAIRSSISGSLENKASVVAAVNQHIANLQVILSDITSGFVPYDATLPVLGE